MRNIQINTDSFFVNKAGKEFIEAQWEIIDNLFLTYNKKEIRGTNNLFQDNEWRDKNSLLAISWEKFDTEISQPKLLLFKIVCYYQITFRNTSISTVSGYLSTLNQVFESIFGKILYKGIRGTRILGFDDYSETIINLRINRLVKLGEISPVLGRCLSLFKELPNRAINNFPLFMMSLDLPWSGVGFAKWLSTQYQKLNIALPETKPYLSIPAETIQPLIARSMYIMSELAPTYIEVHSRLKTLNRKLNFKLIDGLHEIYITQLLPQSNLLNRLIPLPNELETRNKLFNWWKRSLYLIQGACLNIILLTTGLRNLDIRSLRAGCCKPSGNLEMLYYIDANISKTKNRIQLPVPEQTKAAISILENFNWTEGNPYVVPPSIGGRPRIVVAEEFKASADRINLLLITFAQHFDIPFTYSDRNDSEYTAHCYRATVAGWLEASSNLSILLVRRLFGHSNNVMPLSYLHHNPIFIKARKESLELAAGQMAKNMAFAASQGKLSGIKGVELESGFSNLIQKSYSLTEKAILKSFQEQLKERILRGGMYAMMTPMGVICTRNPNDSSQSPCRKITNKNILKESAFDRKIFDHLQSLPNPEQCVGNLCEHAMLGPWSTSLRDSFLWYVGYLEKTHGLEFTEDILEEQASFFIKQYAPDMMKIFGVFI